MMKKKQLLAAFLGCSIFFSALGTTASAHKALSTVKHSPAETHWEIEEEGYINHYGYARNEHSSGNGILIIVNVIAICLMSIKI